MASPWTVLRGAVDPIARRYNLYSAYRIGRAEHVATTTVRDGVPQVREMLVALGYEPQYLSAAKAHPDATRPWNPHEDLHDLSYRKVPSVHPIEVAGTTITEWAPAECQYHVHVFVDGETVEWFSHYELRPDFFQPSFSLERLQTHYRPVYGQEYHEGVTTLPFGVD